MESCDGKKWDHVKAVLAAPFQFRHFTHEWPIDENQYLSLPKFTPVQRHGVGQYD